MALNPRLLRPKSTGPVFKEKGYTRLWGLTTKSGAVSGTASTDTGQYAVKWWDNTTELHNSGDTFSRPSTSLLLHFDGANGSTTFIDSSANALAVTANGSAAISTAQSKFGGASGYFDGSGANITVPASLACEFGGSDFTVECWVRFAALPSNNWASLWSYGDHIDTNPRLVLYLDTRSSQGSPGLRFSYVTSTLEFDVSQGDSSGWSVDQWYHVAVTRSGTAFRLFVDGVEVGGATYYGSVAAAGANGRLICGTELDTAYAALNGYIDELRITKGAALYTSNFTPPTAPLSPLPVESGKRAFEVYPVAQQQTSLLLHFDGSNGSTTFIDSSPNAATVTAHGDAAISTAESKFGGASVHFDGYGDYLTVPHSTDFEFGTGDFTIEFWFWAASDAPGEAVTVSFGGGYPDGMEAYVKNVSGMARLEFACNDGDGWSGASMSGNEAALEAWNHAAIVRHNGVVTGYLNGVTAGTTSDFDGALDSDAGDATVGGRTWGAYFSGYIDELRIVKGVALYTSNFTPPTAPLAVLPTVYAPSGQFDGFNVSGNGLTQLRAENVTLGSTAGTPPSGGYNVGSYPYYTWVPYNPGSPATAEQGNLSANALSAAALDQFYTDLDAGSGDLFVTDNPGIVGDDPTIATDKGYTVFGSVPP